MKPAQLIGLILGGVTSLVVFGFTARDLFTNPGGAEAFFLLLAWLALAFVLTVFAIASPRTTYPVLVLVVAILLLFSVTTIPMARSVWEFENANGPFTLMALVATMVPLVALGKALPSKAGWLMLITLGGVFASQALSLLFVGQASTIAEFAEMIPTYLASALLFLLAGKQLSKS